MERTREILTSPSQRMRNRMDLDKASAPEKMRNQFGGIFRKEWEKRFVQGIPACIFCSHETREFHESDDKLIPLKLEEPTTNLHIRLRLSTGEIHDLYQDLGFTDDLNDIKNDYYEKVFKAVKSGNYEQTATEVTGEEVV